VKKPEIKIVDDQDYELTDCPDENNVVDACQSFGCKHFGGYIDNNGFLCSVWRMIYGGKLKVLRPVCNHPKLQEKKECGSCLGVGGCTAHSCVVNESHIKGPDGKWSFMKMDSFGSLQRTLARFCLTCGKELEKIPCDECGKVSVENEI